MYCSLLYNLPQQRWTVHILRLSIEVDGTLLFAGIPLLEFNLRVQSESEELDPENNKQTLIQPLVSVVRITELYTVHCTFSIALRTM